MITRTCCKNSQTLTVADDLSHHNAVIADHKVPISPTVSIDNVFYRAIHTVKIASFVTDIITSDLVTYPKEHVSDLYTLYRQIPTTLLDKHAPIKFKSVSQKPTAPWMTPEIIHSKCRRRYLERFWLKLVHPYTGHATHGSVIYVTDTCLKQSRIITKPWSPQLNNSATPKQLWKCIDQILHRRPAPSLPTHASIRLLCKYFSSHLKNSLTYSAFTDDIPDIVNADSPKLNSQLASFEPTTTAVLVSVVYYSNVLPSDINISLRKTSNKYSYRRHRA